MGLGDDDPVQDVPDWLPCNLSGSVWSYLQGLSYPSPLHPLPHHATLDTVPRHELFFWQSRGLHVTKSPVKSRDM